MNPYDILGVPVLAAVEVARAAYRTLAMQYHPDRGGDAEKFKAVKAAWEAIEGGGWVPPAPTGPPPRSSMSDGPPPPPKRRPERPKQPFAGKPAKGYEARNTPPPIPSATIARGSRNEYEVTLEITQDQGMEGCTIPFRCAGTMLEYEVRPGTMSSGNFHMSAPLDGMIGAQTQNVSVKVRVEVLMARSPEPELKRDAEISLPLCALGLFTGGRVRVVDHLGAQVSITIPPGYDPTEPFRVKGHGFGTTGSRGDLLVTIKPVFVVPNKLNQNERLQLQRLNEMTRDG
jgi:hypothetical protein